MSTKDDLQRFVTAQEGVYQSALHEIISGRKYGHWMWFIFPQLKGLGYSSTSQFYGINRIQEAEQYLQHSILGARLKEISQASLSVSSKSAKEVFGTPDDIKLISSMTLFAEVPNADPVFQQVLDKFYNGKKDERTLLTLRKTI